MMHSGRMKCNLFKKKSISEPLYQMQLDSCCINSFDFGHPTINCLKRQVKYAVICGNLAYTPWWVYDFSLQDLQESLGKNLRKAFLFVWRVIAWLGARSWSGWITTRHSRCFCCAKRDNLANATKIGGMSRADLVSLGHPGGLVGRASDPTYRSICLFGWPPDSLPLLILRFRWKRCWCRPRPYYPISRIWPERASDGWKQRPCRPAFRL